MNLTFITTKLNLESGGGSNITVNLMAKAFVERGHNVNVITVLSDSNRINYEPPYNLIEERAKRHNWPCLEWAVFKILKKYEDQSDIFYFEGNNYLWGCGLYRLLGGKTKVLVHCNKYLYCMHEWGVNFRAWRKEKKNFKQKINSIIRKVFERTVGRVLANRIDYYTCDTPVVKEWHVEYGIKESKMMILAPLFDLERFYVNDKKIDDFNNGKINILYVGRLSQEKGIDVLIKAIKDLKTKEEVFVHIIGSGPDKEEFKKLAKDLAVEQKIKFYDWVNREDLPAFYKSADIYVHPARWAEPLGLTIPEAMASGLPVIAPRISGSSWAMGRAGLIFENGDEKDLREKLEKMVNDDSLRKELASYSKEDARKFDYRESIEKFEALFKKYSK